ncbi:MAG: glycosyltransferase family 4 protein [Methanobacteriaceae archaeon]|nr:glycosyltransferase family 4 protein [Methanobacteriaceae archaeon]
MKELRILHPDQIYPQKSGGLNRTFQLAKLAADDYVTSIYGIDENEFDDYIEGIRLVQVKKFNNFYDKIKYSFDALFSKQYSIINSKEPIKNLIKNTVFQIEGPYIFNYLKKQGIKNYILDEQNVYWEFSNFPFQEMRYKIYNTVSSQRDKKIEINAIKEASHVLVCSDRDKNEIIKEVPLAKEKITIIPNCVNLNEYKNLKSNSIQDNERPIVLFMGLLSYEPNRDAVKNICEIIAPELTNEIDFVIIGKNPPKITAPSNVKFLGYVNDPKIHMLNSDICIAPLRYGSGTRLKILEYMAMKKPVLSTSKGAEGISYTDEHNIIIEDKIELFAKRIKELLNSENDLGKNGFKLIKEHYDWKLYKKTLCEVYDEVL